jgi:pimeloyl-ACP methyl ester carboxylesterase
VDLVVPMPQVAPRSSRGRLGHFVGDVGYDGFAHYLRAYQTGMAGLPPFSALVDVPTSFGTVRAYRFDGPAENSSTPVVLLPGRNASTPMWRANLPGVLEGRTAYCVDLLGEAGLSVQEKPITGPDHQAQWLDETLAGLGLDAAHLMGVSIGGWTATNYAVRRQGRVASLVLLDPAMTFARQPAHETCCRAGRSSSGPRHRTPSTASIPRRSPRGHTASGPTSPSPAMNSVWPKRPGSPPVCISTTVDSGSMCPSLTSAMSPASARPV